MKDKICKVCLKEKKETDFYFGRRKVCKKCHIKRNNEYDKKHLEQKRKRARDYQRRKALLILINKKYEKTKNYIQT